MSDYHTHPFVDSHSFKVRLCQHLLFHSAVNSDLHFTIRPDGLGGSGLSEQGFSNLWAAARATWGLTGGKYFYEVKVEKNLDVDLPDTEEHPNALRLGWSVDEAGLGLGEALLSYGYGSTGKVVVNNRYNEYGETYGPGDVIGCYVVRFLSLTFFVFFFHIYFFLCWTFFSSNFSLLTLHTHSSFSPPSLFSPSFLTPLLYPSPSHHRIWKARPLQSPFPKTATTLEQHLYLTKMFVARPSFLMCPPRM